MATKQLVSKSIDAWCQIAHPNFIKGVPEVQRLLIQSKASKQVLEKGVSPEMTIKLMDEAGIEKLCLSAWYRPGKAVISNELIYEEWTNKFPDRFLGIAGVNLLNLVEASKQLKRLSKIMDSKVLELFHGYGIYHLMINITFLCL